MRNRLFHAPFSILHFLCLLWGAAAAQPVYTVWPLGTNEFPDTVPGYGNVVARFEPGVVKVFPANLRMNFESTSAAVSDELGNLRCYTNGCYVADALGDTMPGGAGLNPGEIADWTCATTGYICPKGAMILPWPGRPQLFVLLHLGARYDAARKITYGPLYYSVIDLSQNGGKGVVVSKNNILLDGDLEPFSVVRHGNGRDWWLVVPEYGSNRYHTAVLSPAGWTPGPVQEIGPALHCKRVGSSAFSPNGLRYGRQQNCQTVVLDFDRCAGQFSSPVSISTPAYTFGGGGIGFSPDGSRLYTTSQLTVLEADLSQSAPKFDTLIFTYDYWQWGTSMGPIQQGADNNLYISNMAREKYFSRVVFGKPDGSDAQYEFKVLVLPRFSVRTSPHEPNFRLGDWNQSPCDTLGINPTVEAFSSAQLRITLSPNPVQDLLHIRLDNTLVPSAESLRFVLTDALGHILREQLLISQVPTGQETDVDVSNLPAGIYFWQLSQGVEGSREALQAGKVVIGK